MRFDSILKSPQQVDPLSWFAGPLIPLVFAACELLFGSFIAIGTRTQAPLPWLQLPALLLLVLSCVLLHLLTRPHRRQFGLLAAFACLLPAWCGVLISAMGYAGGTLPVEQWWAVMGLALLIAGFGPYLPAIQTALVGLLSAVVAGALTAFAFVPSAEFWPPATTVLFGASAVFFGTVLGCVFGQVVVSAVLGWLAAPAAPIAVSPEAGAVRPDDGIARLIWRVTPFLEHLAETGRVTPVDRAVAAQLARRLREDLVTRANRTWLDTIARDKPLKVLDPDNRADLMTSSQRSALRGLLLAVLESPVLDQNSVLIELRGQADGSTAVAMTMDLELPEGRRVVVLAPYYLTLKTSVRDLRWSNGKSLELTFHLPPKH